MQRKPSAIGQKVIGDFGERVDSGGFINFHGFTRNAVKIFE